MEENLKIPFFRRVKKAVTDFEAYADFALEKTNLAIKYYAKIMIIFSIIISIAFCYKFSTVINDEEQLQIMYNQMAENGIDMQMIDEGINYIKSNNNFEFYAMLALSIIIYMYCVFFVLGFGDILLISILGIIISRITRIRLRYKPVFIMSIYALTLPIILNCIYIIVNMLTGFTIDYFSIVYNVIAYIYIITAILMIKTDFIEHQQELIKIVNEQRKVKKEQRENKEPDEDQKNEEKQEPENQEEEPKSEPET